MVRFARTVRFSLAWDRLDGRYCMVGTNYINIGTVVVGYAVIQHNGWLAVGITLLYWTLCAEITCVSEECVIVYIRVFDMSVVRA